MVSAISFLTDLIKGVLSELIFIFDFNRVSGDRLLMRQQTLRLGVLLYWIALHALLASFI